MAESGHILGERGKSLEDEFFHKEDKRLIERLRELKAKEVSRETLAKASGITNHAILDRLVQLGVHAETVAALGLVPLVEVAWADGSIDEKERRAVLERAEKSGIAPGSTAHELLASWLQHRPEPRLLTAWTHLVQGLGESLNPEQLRSLRADLVERAHAVARASGGLLGVGKVSNAEAEMIRQLEAAFGPK